MIFAFVFHSVCKIGHLSKYFYMLQQTNGSCQNLFDHWIQFNGSVWSLNSLSTVNIVQGIEKYIYDWHLMYKQPTPILSNCLCALSARTLFFCRRFEGQKKRIRIMHKCTWCNPNNILSLYHTYNDLRTTMQTKAHCTEWI